MQRIASTTNITHIIALMISTILTLTNAHR